MKKRILSESIVRYRGVGAAFLIAAAALGMTGCSSSVPSVITVENPEAAQNMITVTGKEEVKVVPDMAEIIFAVRTEAESAEACQQQNAETLNQTVETLQAMGVKENSIQTSSYGMSPRYDWSSNRQTLIGYEMETTLTVSDIPIADVGSILSKSVESGINQINSVSYFASKYDESYEEALKLAVEAARKKAEVLAEAGGRTLGDVIAVQEFGYDPVSRYTDSGMRSANSKVEAMAADMAAMPGEIQVEAQVTVDFALK